MSTVTNGHEREAVVLSGVRTAVGKYGGSLKDFPPAKLAAMVGVVGHARYCYDMATNRIIRFATEKFDIG